MNISLDRRLEVFNRIKVFTNIPDMIEDYNPRLHRFEHSIFCDQRVFCDIEDITEEVEHTLFSSVNGCFVKPGIVFFFDELELL